MNNIDSLHCCSDDEDRGRLLKQLSSINRPLGVTFLQMMKLMSQCEQVKLYFYS